MSERQREYFRQKLTAWKEEILKEARDTLAHLQAENENHPDLADRASSETDRAIELRARDRQRKLIAKIDAALARLDDGTYGYCEETGEPISIKRLGPSPRSRSRRRSATSGASAFIATSNGQPRWQRPCRARDAGEAIGSGLGGRPVQQARHLLLEAVVERFPPGALVAAALARVGCGICGSFVRRRCGRLVGRLGWAQGRAEVIAPERPAQCRVRPGRRRSPECLGRRLGLRSSRGAARVVALGGAA